MELFSISCTTCQTRLKVRDETAIGQILACPKCSSMVLVEPPTDWQPPESSGTPETASASTAAGNGHSAVKKRTATAAAPLDSTFDEAAAMFSDTPPVIHDKAPARQTRPPAEAEQSAGEQAETASAAYVSGSGDDPTTDDPPYSEDKSDAAANRPAKADEASATPTRVNDPILPGADWISPAARQWQQWLLFGVAIVVGLVFAFGIFGFITYRLSQSGGDQTANAETDTAKQDVDNTSTAAVTDSVKSSDDGSSLPDDDPPADENKTTPKAPVDPVVPVTPKPADTDDPKPKVAPMDLVPKTDGGKGGEPASTKSLLDGLNEFGKFIEDAPFDAEKATDPTADTDSLPAGVKDGVKPLPRPPHREIDVAARMNDPIAGLEFANIPLTEFLQFVSDMSTIPITIDPAALAQVNVSPAKTIQVNQAEATVGKVLDAAVTSLGLGLVPGDGQLLITHTKSANSELGEMSYRVDDLAADADQLADLGDLLVELIDPQSWKSAGGGGTIELKKQAIVTRQSASVHFQTLVFFEKLRVARGIKPRSRYSAELFDLTPPTSRAEAKLAMPISMNYLQPIRLVDMLRKIEQQAGIHILIDWQAAAEIGWTPDTEMTLTVDKQPLSDTLAKLLVPMELTYRVVDATMLQITTPKALAERVELDFYPVATILADDKDANSLIDRIKTSLKEQGSPEGIGVFHFDSQSKCLLIALPQPQQIAVAQMLDEWRAK